MVTPASLRKVAHLKVVFAGSHLEDTMASE